MAQCKLTPHEFIQNAFSPMVAVMCSSFVDQTCQKNNLSFIEMIQPFCKLNAEAHFREPSGTLVTVRNLRITMLDVNSRPPQPTLARKFLNESVSMSWNERNTSLQIGEQTIEVPASVPWFEAWRETFLQVQFPSDHEFTKHYIACILVVSSAENNPTDTLQHMEAQLQQLQTVTPAKLPKWFCPKVLRYYVLLHDAVEGDGAKAENTLGAMKQVYGDNLCFFLQTNSRPPGQNEDHSHLPDPWSQFLTRQLDVQDGSDQESSPRTPAEMGGVTGMPSHVMTDGNMDGDVVRPPNMGPIVMSALEVAQEAGENAAPVVVTHHPLSPDTEHHKNNYGNDSAAIPSHINANVWVGQSTTATLQHGAHLTASDLDRLRMLVQEFCIKALLPYVERQIQQLSDTISNKKGVSRSLFSATKRWFGSNKPGSPGSNTPLNAVIYSSDAPELQMRRLGDLCFMFGHYSLAFQAYHSAKRDFNADQAWLYYAGALEMAALSAFMQGEVTRKAQEYMDEAIVTYLNSCKMQQFATRATLLSTECLKGRSLYGEAAKQFIRMTSEDSDLRSALLLEQASYCFLKATRPRMLRKYAFHIVLAGHRFSKASQRKHSLRCYRQAYQVYENKNWSLAEDHIYFTIGRQAANLKQISEAAQAFAKLLTPASRQSATQQAAFLREFLITQQQLIAEEGHSSLPVLPLPLIDGDSIKVLMGDLPFHPYCDGPSPVVPATGISFAKDSALDTDARWGKLEELLITEAQGSLPMIFKPTVQLYTNETNNTSRPVGIVKEPVTLSIMLQNPLHMPLPLGNLRLLWRFAENKKQEDIISNEIAEPANSPIETQCLETLLLNPHCTREVILKVVPMKIGELDIIGLAYNIANPNDSTSTVTGKQVFRIRASRPLPSKSRTTHEVHDRRLELSIVKPAPCLQVLFRDLCSEMLCGEIRHIGLEFCNTGSTPLTSLYVASLNPELYSLGEPAKVANVTQISLPGGQLSPGQMHSFPMWLRAPDTKGPANLDMLFYYENPDSSSIPRYRLVRHFWQLSVLSSVQLSSTAFRSCRAQEEVLNLKLCIKNCSQIHDPWIAEIYLLQVSLAGHKWRLSQDVVVPSDVKLQAQELVHFLAKVERHHGPNSEEKIFSDVVIAQQHETAGLKRTSPYIDFFHRYQQSISEPTKSEAEFENIARGMETALKLDAILVVRWRASVTAGDGKKWAALGQSHLLLDQVGTTVTWPLPSEPALHQEPLQGPLQIFGREDSSPTTQPCVSLDVLQKLVTYTIMHSPCIKHDFKCSRLCVVPVQLILRNCCDNQLVVRVNSISNSSSVSVGNKNQLYSPHPSSAFRWVGLAETWMELEPHGSTAVHLSAAVGSPGTYNLGNRLEILCRAPEAPETDAVAQSWRIESSLIVISSIKS